MLLKIKQVLISYVCWLYNCRWYVRMMHEDDPWWLRLSTSTIVLIFQFPCNKMSKTILDDVNFNWVKTFVLYMKIINGFTCYDFDSLISYVLGFISWSIRIALSILKTKCCVLISYVLCFISCFMKVYWKQNFCKK